MASLLQAILGHIPFDLASLATLSHAQLHARVRVLVDHREDLELLNRTVVRRPGTTRQAVEWAIEHLNEVLNTIFARLRSDEQIHTQARVLAVHREELQRLDRTLVRRPGRTRQAVDWAIGHLDDVLNTVLGRIRSGEQLIAQREALVAHRGELEMLERGGTSRQAIIWAIGQVIEQLHAIETRLEDLGVDVNHGTSDDDLGNHSDRSDDSEDGDLEGFVVSDNEPVV
ncbi:hypothetical protein BT63DRAFT_138469 [Microthyrium microscopicum]|uniref:Uncharacterized protein n=1 Tax=Microthyrium microscopicum TaxID=703497 RepID=A0A6A6UPM9_9PEZI|nr:hypothetical protein BT63DRAFT_138469 [Microthyrium microscopicum]